MRTLGDFFVGLALGGVAAAMMIAGIGLVNKAWGQENHHPPQDMALHEKFYSTWRMPNNGQPRINSCCNMQDCYPTEIKKVGGHWFAQRREDGEWIAVPDSKIENNQPDPRESPDGQSHVCMSSPPASNVYCAVLGSGM